MHLRNLVWFGERPLAFDCLEFDPDLRWIDILSEIAFLVMDLDSRKQQKLAYRFLNTYLEHTGDYNGMPVFRFYLVYRALVRAMVNGIRCEQGESSCRSVLQLFKTGPIVLPTSQAGIDNYTWIVSIRQKHSVTIAIGADRRTAHTLRCRTQKNVWLTRRIK
jgi:hypothetical protein